MTLTIPNPFTTGTDALAAEVNENFDDVATEVNANYAALAGQYKTLLVASVSLYADFGANTYVLGAEDVQGNAAPLPSTGNLIGNDASQKWAPPMIYFDDADAIATSLTQKLRVRFQVNTNATAWSSVTATAGLYPVTFAGAADTLTPTLGTVVTGSTVAIANPSASTTNQGNSGDFTIPSDGQYCLGVVTSAALTNNAVALLTAQLQTRSV